MAQIRGTNTGPEMELRSMLHRAGYRFRLHRKDLPGRPDLVLPMHRLAIQVHGCFWHRHTNCKLAYTPKTNRHSWLKKFAQNTERDRRQTRLLRKLGWGVLTVWECELNSKPDLVLTRVNRRAHGTKNA